MTRILPPAPNQGERKRCHVLLDGRASPPFDGDVLPRSVSFDEAGKLHYIAAKDGNLYRVTQE
jgi:hypothetical protein